MSGALSRASAVAVLGAGTMGAGIARVAAGAGHRVLLFDTVADVIEGALSELRARLGRSVERGKIAATEADRIHASIAPVEDLADLAGAGLVVEAIVEDLGVKRDVFRRLEAIVAPDAILATNTSSLSVTAIAAGLDHPERVVGMHFFNPAPVMPLVEIVSGAATDRGVAATVYQTASAWGKSPVHCASTPGFIVNRVARPYYSEALRLLQEGVGDEATIDAVLSEAGGFRMGPFTLMDLVGLDVNLAVSTSVYEQTYHDARFAPNVLQQAKVDAGHLGRKSGRGWYRSDVPPPPPATVTPGVAVSVVRLGLDLGHAEGLVERFEAAGLAVERDDSVAGLEIGAALVIPTDGRSAAEVAPEHSDKEVLVLDLVPDWQSAERVAVTGSRNLPEDTLATVAATLGAAGLAVTRVADVPAVIVMRTIAQLVSVAADAAMAGVASPEDIDLAMRLGTNYPAGPFEWADQIGVDRIVAVVDRLRSFYGEERYRCAGWLRRAWLEGVPLRSLATETVAHGRGETRIEATRDND